MITFKLAVAGVALGVILVAVVVALVNAANGDYSMVAVACVISAIALYGGTRGRHA